jgi:hypothetical protein
VPSLKKPLGGGGGIVLGLGASFKLGVALGLGLGVGVKLRVRATYRARARARARGTVWCRWGGGERELMPRRDFFPQHPDMAIFFPNFQASLATLTDVFPKQKF